MVRRRTYKALGIGTRAIDVLPTPVIAQRAPATTDTDFAKGQLWIDESASPSVVYTHLGGGDWDTGGNQTATTSTAGIVTLDDDLSDGATANTVPTSQAAKDYADSLAIAGAPDASETVKGIAEIATTDETIAFTDDERIVTPSKLSDAFASPPAIGGTSAGAGTFTTLAATGAVDFDAGGSWESGGANDIDIGADANTDAINVGTGAAARTITIGNVTGATALALNSGTGGIALASTGAGDITINSDDTILLDADGVLELNSSGGVIGIGNDADANNINIGTGAAARTITVGNGTGATQIDLDAGTGGINVGTNAIAHSISIGNVTGATAIAMSVGTGNFDLDGVGASTYSIGDSTTSGTVTIGGSSQTGNFILGPSDGVMTAQLANGNGAKTINIGDGVDGNTITIGNGINTSAQTINIANGASGANSTINILSGNGTAGTQTLNVLGGNRAGALNLATGSAAHVIAIGSASAGAITVDTAAGISLDAATASNLTVSGATEDLTLESSGGRVIVNAGENAADAIYLHANAGISEKIRLHSDQGTSTDSIELESDVGGVTVTSGLASANAFDVNLASGGMAVDAGDAISLDAAAASNFNVTGATNDLTLGSAGGRVIIDAGEDAADAIYLHANAGTSEKIRLHADQGTSADSVELESDVGGITLTSGLASTDAINLNASAGGIDMDGALEINITSSEAAADAIHINASDGSGGIYLTGAAGVDVRDGDLKISGSAEQLQVKGGAVTDFIGTATLVNGTVTVANTNIAATDRIFIQRQSINGSAAIGNLTYSISAGASFTITSVQDSSPSTTETSDDSIVMYFIVRQL